MGDNITNDAGAGNISYNIGTEEVDLNISDNRTWSDMEKVSHELKHAYQVLEGKLGFNKQDGTNLFYDKTDEIEAFRRQNLFTDSPVDPIGFTQKNYSPIPDGPKGVQQLSNGQRELLKKRSSVLIIRNL